MSSPVMRARLEHAAREALRSPELADATVSAFRRSLVLLAIATEWGLDEAERDVLAALVREDTP